MSFSAGADTTNGHSKNEKKTSIFRHTVHVASMRDAVNARQKGEEENQTEYPTPAQMQNCIFKDGR